MSCSCCASDGHLAVFDERKISSPGFSVLTDRSQVRIYFPRRKVIKYMERFSEQQILPKSYIVFQPSSEVAKTKPPSVKAKVGLYFRGTDYNLVKIHQMRSEAKPSY